MSLRVLKWLAELCLPHMGDSRMITVMQAVLYRMHPDVTIQCLQQAALLLWDPLAMNPPGSSAAAAAAHTPGYIGHCKCEFKLLL